jgi:hypothetical protein
VMTTSVMTGFLSDDHISDDCITYSRRGCPGTGGDSSGPSRHE